MTGAFYPGWEASIDGKKTRIWKTNGVMRGVVVPQGAHIVVFTYVPRLIYACTIVGAVMLVTVLFMLFRKDHQSPVRNSKT